MDEPKSALYLNGELTSIVGPQTEVEKLAATLCMNNRVFVWTGGEPFPPTYGPTNAELLASMHKPWYRRWFGTGVR